MPASRIALLAAALLAVGLVWFATNRNPPAAPAAGPEDFAAAYRGLCETESAAATDLARARDVFYVKSHTSLHVLAEDLTAQDTALAARLLEEKNRVEGALGGDSGEAAVQALESLLLRSRQALEFLGVPYEPCP